MSAILLQLTGRSRLSLLQTKPCFRISAKISNYHSATPSWSSTFAHRRPMTGPFSTFCDRPIFTSAFSSLRHHPPENPFQARRFFGFLNKIPQEFIFYGIIGINSAVFMMWYMATQKSVSDDLPCYVSCVVPQLANYRSNKAIRHLSYG
jgi:hypothetical protein